MAGSTAKRQKRKSSGSIKASSVSARVSKFDEAVIRYIKKNRPSEKELVAFVQDEWQKKTHSYLPATTAKKVAKRFMNVTAVGKYKTRKTRKGQSGGRDSSISGFQHGGRDSSIAALQSGGMAPLDGAHGGLALPGAPLGTTLLRVPEDVTTSAVFASASPVNYYQIAQDRSAGTDSFAGLKPGPAMGSNQVGGGKTRKNRKQRGGSAFSIPGSVPASVAQLGIGHVLGQQAPVRSSPNPVLPGFKDMYSPLAVSIEDNAARINNQLGLVWKTTA